MVAAGIADGGFSGIQGMGPAAVPARVYDAIFEAQRGGFIDIGFFEFKSSHVVVYEIGPYGAARPYPGGLRGTRGSGSISPGTGSCTCDAGGIPASADRSRVEIGDDVGVDKSVESRRCQNDAPWGDDGAGYRPAIGIVDEGGVQGVVGIASQRHPAIIVEGRLCDGSVNSGGRLVRQG